METSTARPRAYSYTRISSDAQAHGHGIQRQLTASMAYAEKHGLDLVDEARLEDIGVSAYRGTNVAEGALGRFLAAAQAGKIPAGSSLLIENLDRLSRQKIRKSLNLFLSILDAGINIVTLSDGHVYTAAKTELVDFMVSLLSMSRAHEESEIKSHRVRAAWANKRANASTKPLTAMCPAWLKLAHDRSRYVLIPERGKVVRMIFEESIAGIGVYSITQRLNKKRVPTFRGAAGWTLAYVLKILRSRATIGEYQPHKMVEGRRRPDGDPVKGYFEPVISEEVFYRAQHGLSQRLNHRGSGPKGTHFNNLFMGLTACAYCHSTMRFESKGGRGKDALVCNGARRGMGCRIARWRYRDFEASFLTFIKEIDIKSVMRDESEVRKRADLDGEIAALKGKVSSVQDQRDRTYALFLESTAVARDFVNQKLSDLEQQRIDLENDVRKKEQERARLEAIRNPGTEEIKDLIAQIQDGSGGDEVYKLRSQLASRLRSLVRIIYMAPIGGGAQLKIETDEPGAGPVVDDIRRAMVTRRYFAVGLHDGSVRVIFPDHDASLRFTHLDPPSGPDDPGTIDGPLTS